MPLELHYSQIISKLILQRFFEEICSLGAGVALITAVERSGQESIADADDSVILVDPSIPNIDLTGSDEEEDEVSPPKKAKARDSNADKISQDDSSLNPKEVKAEERKSRIVRKRKIPRANSKPDAKVTCEMCQGPAMYCQPNPNDCPHYFCSACVIELMRSTGVCAICQHSIKTLKIHFF